MSFACLCLALHPEIQNKAREEISKYSKNNGVIEYDDIPKLFYIWAILKETLRMFPTVPLTFRVSSADAKLGPYNVTKGDRIFVNIYGMCYDEKNFSNPNQFTPERWLAAGHEEMDIGTLKNFDITRNFGGGLRVCIGKRFAEEESIVLLALLLSKFSLSVYSIGGDKPLDDLNALQLCHVETVTNVTMTFAKRVSIKFSPL